MSIKKPFGVALVASGFLLLALTGIRTVSHPGLFTHIALGQAAGSAGDPISYTVADRQWINLHPLYNELVAGLWSLGGAPLVTLVHVLTVLAAFLLMFRFGRNWGGALCQTLALILCSRLMLPVFNPEPYAFFMLFTALFLTLLYRIKNFNLMAGALLILQILWTNMHPSFLFGPVLILLFAIENRQDIRKSSRTTVVTPLTKRLLGLSVAALLVTLCNPNLFNLHRHILANWKLLTGKETLEWISLFSHWFPQDSISRLTILTLILGAGGLITLQKRLPAALTTLAIFGAFLTVRSIGSLHLFAFLAFPFLILSFSAISDYLSRTMTTLFKTGEARMQNIMAILTVLLAVASIGSLITNRAYVSIGSASHFGLGVQNDAFPSAAMEVIRRADFPQKILNIAHDGGYIAVHAPGRKVFCDTRTSLYGLDFLRTLNQALLGQPKAWNSIMEKWSPHAVAVNTCWPEAGDLTARMIASRNWKLIYFDGSTALLVRNLPEYASLLSDRQIQSSGLALLEKARQEYSRQGKLFKQGTSSRLIGAGTVYLSLNRAQQAGELFALLARHNPRMAGAWLGLGRSLVFQRQLSNGLAHMEHAARITPNSGQVWIRLFEIYRLKGDEAKMREASDQLTKFYKAETATVEQQAVKEDKKAEEKPTEKSKGSEPSGFELPDDLKK